MKTTTNDIETRSSDNWGAETWRAPELAKGDTLLFSEHGRVLDGVDYRAFYFRIVQDEFKSGRSLLVKHGGGQERISLGFYAHAVEGFEQLTSDARYHMMHLLYRLHTDATRNAQDATAARYNTAFAEGRLKKRKVVWQNMVRVWIEN